MRRQFGYEELRGVGTGGRGVDRLDGRPTVVFVLTEGPYLITGAGMGAPIVQELADRLAGLRLRERFILKGPGLWRRRTSAPVVKLGGVPVASQP